MVSSFFKSKWPFLAAAFGFLLSLILFSPGFLDNDTLGQLIQAQKNSYHEWHPPLMAYTWHWLLQVLPNTWGFFLLDNLAVWFGLASLLAAFLPHRPKTAAALVLLFGLNPAFFAINSLVWKDAVFAALMLVGTVSLLWWDKRPRPVPLIIGLGALFYAVGIRHNGIFAIFPFIVWIIWRGLPHVRFYWKSAAAVIAGLAVVFAHGKLSRWLTAGDNGFAEQVVLSFDLAGMSVRSGEMLYPADVGITLDELRRVYRPYSVLPLFWEDANTMGMHRPGFFSAKFQEEWHAAWLHAILTHPAAYFEHRLEFSLRFLGIHIGPERGYIFFPAGDIPQNPSWFRFDRLTAPYVGWVRRHEHDLPFRTYAYFFPLCFFTGYFGWRRYFFEFALAASGMFYTVSFFIAGVAADYRYAFWIAIVTCAVAARFLGVTVLRERALSTDGGTGAEQEGGFDPAGPAVLGL